MIFSRKYPLTALIAASALLMTTPIDAAPSARAKQRPSTICNIEFYSYWNVRANPDGPFDGNAPFQSFRLEAFSNGPSCRKALVVFVIRNLERQILHTQAYQAAQLATFGVVRTRDDMNLALADWTGPGKRENDHDLLTDWPIGANKPIAREFGLIIDPSITRAHYLAIKANRTPYVCYVQGMESMKCLVLQRGVLKPFGIQRFPG